MNTKFTLLILTALIIAVASNAQINKGNTALGGNLSFSTTSEKTSSFKQTSTNFYVSPSLMTVYANNRAIGFNLNYGHASSEPYGKSNSYGAGIFLRQYKPLGSGFYLFAQEALAFNYSKGNTDSSANTSYVDNRGYTIRFAANPGLAYDLSKNFQLEVLFFNNLVSASYNNTRLITSVNSPAQKYNSFSIGANLDASQLTSLNIGAKIFFGR